MDKLYKILDVYIYLIDFQILLPRKARIKYVINILHNNSLDMKYIQKSLEMSKKKCHF